MPTAIAAKTKITRRKASNLLPIPHPGEALKLDFVDELGLSGYAVAKALGVPQIAISQIIRGQRGISAEMALRLGRYTGTGAEFWKNLQSNYELKLARRAFEEEIEKSVQPIEQRARLAAA